MPSQTSSQGSDGEEVGASPADAGRAAGADAPEPVSASRPVGSIPDAITEEQVRALLAERAREFAGKRRGSNGRTLWAKAHSVPKNRVSDFMTGTRAPNTAILSALGLEWQIVRKRPAQVDERPKGQDPKGLGAKPASAVGEADAPKDTRHDH